jgi:signal peptidase II
VSPSASRQPPPWPWVLGVAVAVIVIDQITKWWAIERLSDGPIAVVGSLRLRLVFNEASAFSIGGGAAWGPFVTVVGLVVIVGLLWFVRATPGRLPAVAAGLVVGGAVGNLIDRAARSDRGFMGGGVVDFVDLGWWPVFNVADAAVVVGVVLLLGVTLFGGGEHTDD